MSTPTDAPYKQKQRELERLARAATMPVATFAIPLPTHRGKLWLVAMARGNA